MRRVLQFQDFEIDTAKNGQDVLDKLKESSFDLILMDISMPVMDGLESTKAIRKLADKSKANTPIIAISGNAINYTEEDYQKAGINEFEPKPLDFDSLVSKIARITGQTAPLF